MERTEEGWEDPNPIDTTYREHIVKRTFQEKRIKAPYYKNPAIAFYIKNIIGFENWKELRDETRDFLLREDVWKQLKLWKIQNFGSEIAYKNYWARKKGFKNAKEYHLFCIKERGFKDGAEYQRFLYRKRKGVNQSIEQFRESLSEKEYVNSENYFGKLRNNHGGGIRNKLDKYKCLCGKDFRLKTSFLNHQKRCSFKIYD